MLRKLYTYIRKHIPVRIFLYTALVCGVVFISFCFAYVPHGKTGVVSILGKVQDKEKGSGIRLKWPWATITDISIQQKMIDSEQDAVAADSSLWHVNSMLFFHIDEEYASDVYRDIGSVSEQRIVATIQDVVSRHMMQFVPIQRNNDEPTVFYDQLVDDISASLQTNGLVLDDLFIVEMLPIQKDTHL